MTAQSKTVIKSYFEQGDRPTQAQFADLIDSYIDAFDINFASDVVADGLQLVDVNITNGTATANSLRYNFTTDDIGATFILTTVVFGSALTGTITGVVAGNATLSANWAGTTISDNTGRMTFYHTDNTSAIQDAIDAVVAEHADSLGHNLVGFKMTLPAGVIACRKITLPRLCMLVGQGAQATTLFCISGTNDNCVESENFSTLVNTNQQYGVNANVPSWFGIENLHIDGNRGGNASGYCLAMYGVSQRIQGDCLFENGAGHNLFTEAGSAGSYSATDWRAEEEAFFENITSRNSGGHGWMCHGPHDWFCIRYTAYNNATWNFYSDSTANYNGGGEIVNIHTYASQTGQDQYYGAGIVVTQSYTDFGNCTIDSSVRIGILRQIQAGYLGLNALDVTANADFAIIGTHTVDFLSSATSLIGVNVQAGADGFTIGMSSGSISPGTSNVTRYKVRAPFVTINASMSNAGGVGGIGLDNSSNYLRFTATGFFNTTGILWAGGSYCSVELQQYQGTLPLSGTPDNTNFIKIVSDTQSFNKVPFINVPVVVQDTSANTILSVSANITNGAATGVGIFPGLDASVQNAEIYVRPSNRAACGLSFRFKGDPPVPFGFHSSASAAASLALYEKGDGNHIKLACPTSVPTTYSFTFPSVLGNANDVLYHTTGGVFTNGRPITVAHAVANFLAGVSAAMVKNDGFSSTIVRNGTGDYSLVLSIPTLDAGSIVLPSLNAGGTALFITATQTSAGGIRIWTNNIAGVAADPTSISVAVFGSP